MGERMKTAPRTETLVLVAALRELARTILSDDGVANAAIAEAADRLSEHDAAMPDAARFCWLDKMALFVDTVSDPDNMVKIWHNTVISNPTTGRTLREAVDKAMKRNDYPWNKLPKERECCGTFPRTPHRATCAKYRGKFNPFNGEVRGASRLAGEASSAEGATSTVVLGRGQQRRQ